MERIVRVAIADDQAMFRQSLRLILGRQPTLVVGGHRGDGSGSGQRAGAIKNTLEIFSEFIREKT
jgi:DNA-binding NarL/FixJ family response regulator